MFSHPTASCRAARQCIPVQAPVTLLYFCHEALVAFLALLTLVDFPAVSFLAPWLTPTERRLGSSSRGIMILWAIILLACIGQCGLQIYMLTVLSDLEADHLNPYDASKRVNAWVDLELGLHVCLSLLLLLSGKWLMLVLTLPLVAIDAHERYKKQHKVEPVTVFRNINRSRNVRVAKLLIAIVCFSFAIYRFVSLLAVNVVGAKQNRNGRRGGKAKGRQRKESRKKR